MKKRWLSLGFALLLAAMTVLPVVAESQRQRIPPIPEWPIIGPLLRRLGVTSSSTADSIETPTPDIPEYRVETLADLMSLEDLPIGERVRIVVSDDDLNMIIAELVNKSSYAEVSAFVTFDYNAINADIQISTDILDSFDFEVPLFRNADSLDIELTTDVNAESCYAQVDIDELKVNNWKFGLRLLTGRALNAWIPDQWPNEICLEQVIITPGELAVEGFRTNE